MPSYVSAMGPDGAPGIAGKDDDGNGTKDDPSEIGAAGSDDFEAITGHQVAQATILDLLHYRVFLELRRKVIAKEGWQEPLTPAQVATLNGFMPSLKYNADKMTENGPYASGEPYVDANNNGIWDIGESYTDKNGNGAYDPPRVMDILAPEVIAGQRMDLNRPFGDGRDSGDGKDNNGTARSTNRTSRAILPQRNRRRTGRSWRTVPRCE